jgi:hypothetical protein
MQSPVTPIGQTTMDHSIQYVPRVLQQSLQQETKPNLLDMSMPMCANRFGFIWPSNTRSGRAASTVSNCQNKWAEPHLSCRSLYAVFGTA